MITIIATIYPRKFIGTEDVATEFFAILEQNGLLPDKIGSYEPLKIPYSLEEAIKQWTEDRGKQGRMAGSMMGKTRKPNIQFGVRWSKGPNTKLSYVTFFFNKTSYKTHKESIELMFRDVYQLVDGIYGYISTEVADDRQHVMGNLETRMPGVFYCNYFGSPYVEFFGKDNILSGPWVKTEVLDSGTVVTYLAGNPTDKNLVESDALEMRAKKHLGFDSFGDLEWQREHPFEEQIRKVPKLELPNTRVLVE